MLEKFVLYMGYPFVIKALITGVAISAATGLLGVVLVLKRFSFISDGISHVAFGAMAIAGVLNISNNMFFVLPVTIICAVIILRAGENVKIRGDAAIAMISVSAMAVGYLILNIFPSGNVSGDVHSTLFGSAGILTLTDGEVILSLVLSLSVIFVFILLYNKIFSVTFDENFAKAAGIRTKLYNLIIAIATAVVIVIAMKLVGALLISALVVFPVISATRVGKSFLFVTVCACILSIVCTFIGIVSSVLFSTPVGVTVVIVYILAFGIFCLVGGLRKR